MSSLQSISLVNAQTKKIGTVTAVALPSEFQFQLSPDAEKPLLQDFVVTVHPRDANKPLLAKIVRISRFNPLFPEESALELAKMTVDESLAPLPLSGKMEMVAAACQVLGSLENGKLVTPGFPVKPGSSVSLPSPKFMQEVMAGDETRSLKLGALRNRSDVPSFVNANEILNKHLAILAMTGSGKTYACSVILEELMKKGYPLLVIDPHADYINIQDRFDKKPFQYNLGKKAGNYTFTTFENCIAPTQLGFDQFLEFVEGLSDEEISSAQYELHKAAYAHAKKNEGKKGAKTGLRGMYEYLNDLEDSKTKSVVFRQLGRVRSLMEGVDASLTFDEIETAIGPGKGVILNMSSLPSSVQTINVQIVLEKLFQKRKVAVISQAKGDKPEEPFPPVFVVVEEAHNFAPAQSEEESALSRPMLRRIATEGRKFGFGMCVISQRPSRLDATVLSQCNSQLILRIVNPNDQTYIRSTVESLAESDLLALPELSQGEALLSGAMTPIPSLIKIRQRESKEGIQAVDRLGEIANWK